METSPTDPFFLLTLDIDDRPEGADPFGEAIKCFDPANPEPLFTLLTSDNPLVRRRGLLVFGYLGNRGFVALDAAFDAVRDLPPTARSGLLDGVLCYTGKLDVTQASRILLLADDESDLVRDKVVAFIGAAKFSVLTAAVGQLDAAVRAPHEDGLSLLTAEHSDVQVLFDRAVATGGIWSTYAFAALERIARRGDMHTLPRYAGTEYVARGTLRNTARIAGNKARAKARG